MAEPVPPDRRDPLADRASVVEITIVPGPRGSPGQGMARIRGRLRGPLLIGLAGVAAVTAAAAVFVSLVGAGSPAARLPSNDRLSTARISGPGPDDPIEAVYRAPFRCLRVVVADGDPSYARAELDRAGSCWRDAAWVTTILHKVGGAWRALLVENSGFCSDRSLPAVVRSELGACPAGGRRRRPAARRGPAASR
jgi:hypothetical protein